MNRAARTSIATAFKAAHSRHLFLDYDGTLVPFAKHPREAVPDKNLLQLLARLSADDRTQVTIISGRAYPLLEGWFRNLPINLVAEHGAAIRHPEGVWNEHSADQSWKPLIRPMLDLFTQRSLGSFVEEKDHTLAWHYRNVDPELGFVRSRELLDNLYHLVRNAQLQVIDGNKVIEVRVVGVDKGVAARNLIQENPSEFVLAIGDDKTDEDMFKALADKGITIKVGPGHTQAQYTVPSQKEVLGLLYQLVD